MADNKLLLRVTVSTPSLSEKDRRYSVEGIKGVYHWVRDGEETQSFYIRAYGDDKAKELLVRYGVIEGDKLRHLCNEMECGAKSSGCKHRQRGTVCRYWKQDGTKRDPSEMPQYYTKG